MGKDHQTGRTQAPCRSAEAAATPCPGKGRHMAEQESNSIANLFRKWRGGDPAAGAEMAKRFSDWYYAITVVRLGEVQGRAPLVKACETFARDIVSVNSSGRLSEWAHGVIQTELGAAGSRIPGGDHPNSITRDRQPSEILKNAWKDLPHERLLLLSHAYSSDYPGPALVDEAEQRGGYPLAILEARGALKRWLKDVAGLPMQVVPGTPEADLAPLPLYESFRLASPAEEAAFEQWILTRFDVCRDIAEFSPFAHALRGGALSTPPVEAPPPAEVAVRAPIPPALKIGFWVLFVGLLLTLIVILFIRFVL